MAQDALARALLRQTSEWACARTTSVVASHTLAQLLGSDPDAGPGPGGPGVSGRATGRAVTAAELLGPLLPGPPGRTPHARRHPLSWSATQTVLILAGPARGRFGQICTPLPPPLGTAQPTVEEVLALGFRVLVPQTGAGTTRATLPLRDLAIVHPRRIRTRARAKATRARLIDAFPVSRGG